MDYARYLRISHYDNCIGVDIINPWDTTKCLRRYALVERGESRVADIIAGRTVVEVPIERAVVYNSVHASMVDMLGAVDKVSGVCEVRYIDSQELQLRIKDGRVADIGEATAPNIERIIDISSDALLTSPFKDAGYGAVEKLGIPIIEGADYMEHHPLGRVEWIKLYGLLFGERERADSIFRSSCTEYLSLKELAATAQSKPTVLSERRYGSQWFVAGGQSYNATLFADAGGDYIFSQLEGGGSIPLSFESVLDSGIDADIWVLKYNSPSSDMSYGDLRGEYEPYSAFGAFKNRRVYGCNTATKRYYEDIPLSPHLLLREYIYIFHPELLPDFEPEYFYPLSE